MKENNLKNKCSLFSIRIVKLAKHLHAEHKEFVMSRQILKSGTSVGANVSESENGESKLDFIHKLGIAQKEINETIYWLDLYFATDYLTEKEYVSIHTNAVEIKKIITTIIRITKSNL